MRSHDPERCECSKPGAPGVQCPNRWTHQRVIDHVRVCAEHLAQFPPAIRTSYRKVR